MIRIRLISILLIFCLAASALTGCLASEPDYDEEGNLIIPITIENTIDRALKNVKSGGSSLNGRFANWHRDMIASGLEVNYFRYDDQLALLNSLRIGSRARNAYILYDYDAESDEYIMSLYSSRNEPLLPFGARHEATHAIREAFAGKGTVETFAFGYGNEVTPLWSAFMPIYDEDAEIVAVLGIDMVAAATLEYPEWNRDSRQWNRLTEWTQETQD
jgi:hypothetical protein